MIKKGNILLASAIMGMTMLFSGCGADLEVIVPLVGTPIVPQETQEIQESIPTEDQNEETKETQETVLPSEETAETEIEESVPEEVFPEITTITISAAGDCSLGNHHEQDYYGSFYQAYDKAQDPGYFFENVKAIFEEDDMTIVNLEGVFTNSDVRQEERTYNIKAEPHYVEILTAGDVEAVSMGNNHRLDYGVAGSKDTVDALEGAGIVYAYDNIVGIYETKGIKIGYVSVNEVAWGLGCNKLISDGIAKLKEQEVDLIIACCHWGIEKDNYTEAYQNELGRFCIDEGADLVLGHHPHVLQGIEEYNGKYIVYSLANFSFGANRNPADKDTMIFQQTFTFVDGEKQDTKDAKIIPCSVSSISGRNNFQPTVLEGEEAARVVERLNTYSKEYGVVIGEDGTLQ